MLTACSPPPAEMPATSQSPSIFELSPPVVLDAAPPAGLAGLRGYGGRGRAESWRLPRERILVAGHVLRAIHIGSSDDFARWERGAGAVPIVLWFDRVGRGRPVTTPEDTLRVPDLTVTPFAAAWRPERGFGRGFGPGASTLALVAHHPDLGELRLQLREVRAPPGGRRVGDFPPGGVAVIALSGVLRAEGRERRVTFGYLDWWPCPGGASLQLDLACARP
ncbi:hypothetical protein [Phenylobacterium zucineum]|uniref:hypothetical protein n=1 Tax=Phenylobacterium zucineum TaxID=284016 RepID=UPI0002FD0F67|nr:hypothetical protein [Phenylobacterium zucineum]